MTVHTDIETFSELDLKKCGVYRYAEHESTEILCMSFARDGEDPELFIPRWVRFGRGGMSYIEHQLEDIVVYWGDLPDWVINADEYRAHNSEFERVILNGHVGQAIGFPHTKIRQWVCTAAKAAATGMPRKLKDVCNALGTVHQKSDQGANAMRGLSKPRKPSKNNPATRWTPEACPDKYVQLYLYNIDDVHCEREVDQALPDLTAFEQRIFRLNQKINDRGIAVDMPTVNRVWDLVEEYRERLNVACEKLTGCRAGQTAVLTKWIQERYPIENLQAATVAEAIQDPDCPKDARKALRIRHSHARKAPDKYQAIQRSVCSDNRLHGMFMYYGAGTGRFSSRIVQLQNLFARGGITDPETAIQLYKHEDLDLLREMYDGVDPLLVFSSTIRGMLMAPEGKDLLCMDYRAIEGRITAWFADEKEMLEVYRTHGLAYEHAAAKMNHWDHTDVEGVLKPMKKKHPKARFSGKVGELAGGFGGGAGALIRAAATGGVDLSEDEAETIKREWRATRRNTVQLWYDLQDAANYAVQHPGKATAAGGQYAKMAFKVEGDWLWMKLPSGRRLAYYKPHIVRDGSLRYLGVDTYTRQWRATDLWYGRIIENGVQATAADILRFGMVNLERHGGYPIIGTVHDENMSEVDEGTGSLQEMEQLMTTNLPACFDGLPIAAAGFRAKRFRK